MYLYHFMEDLQNYRKGLQVERVAYGHVSGILTIGFTMPEQFFVAIISSMAELHLRKLPAPLIFAV